MLKTLCIIILVSLMSFTIHAQDCVSWVSLNNSIDKKYNSIPEKCSSLSLRRLDQKDFLSLLKALDSNNTLKKPSIECNSGAEEDVSIVNNALKILLSKNVPLKGEM